MHVVYLFKHDKGSVYKSILPFTENNYFTLVKWLKARTLSWGGCSILYFKNTSLKLSLFVRVITNCKLL